MQLSSLIGKKIISPSGEQLGYVTGAYLARDLRSLSALTAVDGDEEEFILPIRAVQACNDAIIASRLRTTTPTGVPAPIGLNAYSEKGAELGVVGDWLFGDCDPAFIVVKDGVRTAYAAESVVSEDHVVVYLTGERPAPKKRPNRSTKQQNKKNGATMSEPHPSQNASELSAEGENSIAEEGFSADVEAAAPAAEVPTEPAEEQTVATAKYELGSRNLLGKRVVRSVFDAQGEVVALAGDRITPEVLSRARRKGRLLALTVNTLTNVY